MEELESLDRKALEQEYIASYRYTAGQKLMAGMAVIVMLIGILSACTYLFASLIDAFVK